MAYKDYDDYEHDRSERVQIPPGLPPIAAIEAVLREADDHLRRPFAPESLYVTIFATGEGRKMTHRISSAPERNAFSDSSRYSHYPYHATIVYLGDDRRDAAERILEELAERLSSHIRHADRYASRERLRHARVANPRRRNPGDEAARDRVRRYLETPNGVEALERRKLI
jgi:hypothetical protein